MLCERVCFVRLCGNLQEHEEYTESFQFTGVLGR